MLLFQTPSTTVPVVFKLAKLVTAVESKAIVPEPVIVPPVIGDVVAIAESIRKTSFPSIIIRETPGYLGKVTCVPITEKFVVCISGLGRNTSEIISDKSWVEIINSAALGIQYNNVSLRSAIKIGRLFTERTGLINENISQMIDTLPLGSVSSIAHLGTSIVATSDDIPNLIDSLHKFGDVREY